MKHLKKIVLILYVLVAIINVFSNIIESRDLEHISKPLLMPMLLLGILISLRGKFCIGRVWVGVGLFFSFLGDSFLMYTYKNEVYFMLGLGSFLFAHLSYILGFWKGNITSIKINKRLLLLYGIGYVAFMSSFYTKFGELLPAVGVYAIILLSMGLVAWGRDVLDKFSYWSVGCGGVLFLISDGILAINKFVIPISNEGVWVMSTYISAQLLIYLGMNKD